MRWLVTVGPGADSGSIRQQLRDLSPDIDVGEDPTPMAGGELVYHVDAPEHAAEKLRAVPGVVQVNRSSKPKPFGA